MKQRDKRAFDRAARLQSVALQQQLAQSGPEVPPALLNLGDMSEGFVGPLNMSNAERQAQYPALFPKSRKKRKAKPKSAPKSRYARGGYPVYMPTGAVSGIIGKGDYWTDLKAGFGRAYEGLKAGVPRGTFAKIGGGIGGAFGNAALGGSAGKLVSQILGFGDYSVRSNSLMAMDMGSPVPSFGNMSQGIRMQHREYITDILASGAATFSNRSFPINPAIDGTFPWLATIAANFEQYRVLGMIFEFKSTSSDYATGTALGSVVMATEYDSADPTYVSKAAMENSQYCISTKPSLDAIHPVECDPQFNHGDILFTRAGPVPSGKDSRLYDHGVFQLATVGGVAAAGTALGELWVSYDIEFFKPQLGAGSFYDHFSFTPADVSGTNKRYFGTTDALAAETSSQLGGEIEINAAGSVSYYAFPASVTSGRYLIVYTAVGASTAVSPVLTQAAAVNWQNALTFENQSRQAEYSSASTCEAVFLTATIEITGTGAKWGLTTGQLPGTLTGADLWVHRLNVDSA